MIARRLGTCGDVRPADRAWFLATDVDLDSTYVGGTQSLVDALISDERIEAWPAQVNNSITSASDTINLELSAATSKATALQAP